MDNPRQTRGFHMSLGPIYIIILSSFFLFYNKADREVPMITDWLATLYPWTKSLHVMAVISWMAGLFYLPRLFVYHVERGSQFGVEPAASFEIMEFKLLRMIMGPASIATWVFGLALVFTPGIVDWTMAWPWAKATAVIAMTVFHHWLMIQRKKIARGEGLTGRQYRLMNEVPTLLMAVIVVSVIVKF